MGFSVKLIIGVLSDNFETAITLTFSSVSNATKIQLENKNQLKSLKKVLVLRLGKYWHWDLESI